MLAYTIIGGCIIHTTFVFMLLHVAATEASHPALCHTLHLHVCHTSAVHCLCMYVFHLVSDGLKEYIYS